MHRSRFYLEDVIEAESSQNKDNLGLMERLTSEANARSQAVDRLQALEAKMEKLTTEKASWEARETKVKENASLVSEKSDSRWKIWPDRASHGVFSFQTIAQLKEDIEFLHLEKKNLEEKFEESTTLTNGNVDKNRILVWNVHQNLDTLCILTENFDHFKRTLVEEREYEARLRKYVHSP